MLATTNHYQYVAYDTKNVFYPLLERRLLLRGTIVNRTKLLSVKIAKYIDFLCLP